MGRMRKTRKRGGNNNYINIDELIQYLQSYKKLSVIEHISNKGSTERTPNNLKSSTALYSTVQSPTPGIITSSITPDTGVVVKHPTLTPTLTPTSAIKSTVSTIPPVYAIPHTHLNLSNGGKRKTRKQ